MDNTVASGTNGLHRLRAPKPEENFLGYRFSMHVPGYIDFFRYVTRRDFEEEISRI